jgi:hypothetical protein
MNPLTLPEGIDPKEVQAKMDAGLSKDQAIEVLVNQASHDKNLKRQEKKST